MLVWEKFDRGWKVVDKKEGFIKKTIYELDINDRIDVYFAEHNIFDTAFADFFVDMVNDINHYYNITLCKIGDSYAVYKWLKCKCFSYYYSKIFNNFFESEF